jgi:hypothetical protein
MAKTLSNGQIEVEKGDTLYGIYGSDWKNLSGYTGDPTKLAVGTVLPAISTPSSSGSTIKSSDLSGSSSKITLPDKPASAYYSQSPTPPAKTETEDTPDWLKRYFDSSTAPTSLADLYKAEYSSSGIEDNQKAVDDLTAQIKVLTAEGQSKNFSLENQGAQITAGGVSVSQQANSRELAIKVLPLQALLEAAQGRLTNAQDKFNLSIEKMKDALGNIIGGPLGKIMDVFGRLAESSAFIYGTMVAIGSLSLAKTITNLVTMAATLASSAVAGTTLASALTVGLGGIAIVGAVTAIAAAMSSATKKAQDDARPMAEGGLLYGPTKILAGEYPDAPNNPEVIAPLSDLRNIIEKDNRRYEGNSNKENLPQPLV